MGAKNPVNVKDKEKRTLVTCEDCERDFLNIQAWKSHTMAKHPEKYKQMQTAAAEEKKTAFVPPTSRVSKRLLQKKSIDKDTTSEDSSVSSRRKAIFECPECEKRFLVYFPAYKHIQKYHNKDADGNPLPPDSPDLMKPLRKEFCLNCKHILIEEEHTCKDIESNPTDDDAEPHVKAMSLYSCLGCKKNFQSVASFDDHVAGAHTDDVEILIFGNLDEFLNWKIKIEAQVRTRYLALSNTTQRQYYQCNYVSPKNSPDTTHLCPSMIITREFSKGIHIRYFKEHHGHTIPKQIKNDEDIYSNLIKNDTDDEDLYLKFKNLMKNIALGASKINVSNLTKLYVAALEMQTSLNSYKNMEENAESLKRKALTDSDKADNDSVDSLDNDDSVEISHVKIDSVQKITTTDIETELLSKSMSDDQITKALQAPRVSARLKRKSESLPVTVPKKTKLDSIKDSSKTQTDLHENSDNKDAGFVSPTITKSSSIIQSPSFNDSYKQFIDSALKPTDKNIDKAQTTKSNKKTTTPIPSVDSKDDTTLTPPTDIDAETLKPKVDKKIESTVKSKLQKKTDVTPKPKVDKTNIKKVKKEIVKTRIGQFIQSPKKAALMRDFSENITITEKKKRKAPSGSPKTSIANINLDAIQYEVVEQENDCNILVLKI